MALKIEDYALIGDCHTAAMVGNEGSIDWLCLPRFDSASVFGALLGDPDNGRWKLAPTGESIETSRRYLEDTFILITRWVTPTGEVEVTDLMPYGDRRADLVRRIRGEGFTVLIVEQSVQQVLDLVDRAYLLEVGRIHLQGTSAELRDNPVIRKAYMGL